jgi:hypothetical protein
MEQLTYTPTKFVWLFLISSKESVVEHRQRLIKLDRVKIKFN